MNDQERMRFVAWLDSLEREEREFAERSEGMPVEMAGVYAVVELRREMRADFDAFRDEIREEIASLQRPWWRQLLAPTAVFGAFVGGYFGQEFKVGP